MAKVIKNGIEIAEGHITRVLRGICFSGCGFVKNPANPVSVVLETANTKVTEGNDKTIVLNYDVLQPVDNKVTSDTVEEDVLNTEKATDGTLDDTVGICVSYKRRLYDKAEKVVATDWCTLYEKGCTSFSRDTTDPDCLRNKEALCVAKAMVEEKFKSEKFKDKRETLLNELKAALCEAVKITS